VSGSAVTSTGPADAGQLCDDRNVCSVDTCPVVRVCRGAEHHLASALEHWRASAAVSAHDHDDLDRAWKHPGSYGFRIDEADGGLLTLLPFPNIETDVGVCQSGTVSGGLCMSGSSCYSARHFRNVVPTIPACLR